MDRISKETRSRLMSRIRSVNTQPELMVRKYLHARGFRYRLHDNKMPGKPDIVLPKYRSVIFVHGCFWHGHTGCKIFCMPKSRQEYWINKINGNIRRDAEHQAKLKEMGWNVFVLWECELKKDPAESIEKIIRQLNDNN